MKLPLTRIWPTYWAVFRHSLVLDRIGLVEHVFVVSGDVTLSSQLTDPPRPLASCALVLPRVIKVNKERKKASASQVGLTRCAFLADTCGVCNAAGDRSIVLVNEMHPTECGTLLPLKITFNGKRAVGSC